MLHVFGKACEWLAPSHNLETSHFVHRIKLSNMEYFFKRSKHLSLSDVHLRSKGGMAELGWGGGGWVPEL